MGSGSCRSIVELILAKEYSLSQVHTGGRSWRKHGHHSGQ